MKKESLLFSSFLCAIPCAVAVSVYSILPASISPLIWCVFLGYLTTFGMGADIKMTFNYIFSHILGWGWAYVYLYTSIFCQTVLHLSVPVSMFVGPLFTSTLLMYINSKFLAKTVFGIVPMYFTAVATFFAIGGGMNVLYGGISVVVGIILAVITGPFVSIVVRAVSGNKEVK